MAVVLAVKLSGWVYNLKYAENNDKHNIGTCVAKVSGTYL